MIKSTSLWMAVSAGILSQFDTFFVGENYQSSVLIGAAVLWLNLMGLLGLWRLIFSKKNIALVALAIIFKYLVLVGILWKLSTWQGLHPVGLALGLSSLLCGVLLATFQNALISRFAKK